MTEERLSGLAMMLIHRGTNCMPTPKNIWRRIKLETSSKTSCSIVNVKCTSAWICGVFQINRTSKIRTCKHWKHLPFYTYSRSIFRRHISWQVLISEPPNWKIFWGRIPPHLLYKACAFGTGDNAPRYKNLATALSTEMSIVVNCLLSR